MKQNKYDNPVFFEKYSHMTRSEKGLAGAGEWPELQKMLPDFHGKTVLDLGCGYGWHAIYAAENGAKQVIGIDLSEKMLEEARKRTRFPNVEYACIAIEDIHFAERSFDVVISSLAFHYVPDFDMVCRKVREILKDGGSFVFSCEHPVFTAEGRQEWLCGTDDKPLCWPVDRYFDEGARKANFLGEEVTKYHRSMTTYINTLLKHGFTITGFCEPRPPENMMDLPGMRDELRRPMMMIVAAEKR